MDITRNIEVDEHYTITSEVVGKDPNTDKLEGFGMGVVTGRTLTQQPIARKMPKPSVIYITTGLSPAEQWLKNKKKLKEIELRVSQELKNNINRSKVELAKTQYVMDIEDANERLTKSVDAKWKDGYDIGKADAKSKTFQQFKILPNIKKAELPPIKNMLSKNKNKKKTLGVQNAAVFRNSEQIGVDNLVRKQKRELRTDLKNEVLKNKMLQEKLNMLPNLKKAEVPPIANMLPNLKKAEVPPIKNMLPNLKKAEVPPIMNMLPNLKKAEVPPIENMLSKKKTLGVQNAAVFRNADQIGADNLVRKQKREMRTDLKNEVLKNKMLQEQLTISHKLIQENAIREKKRNIEVNMNTVPRSQFLAEQRKQRQIKEMPAMAARLVYEGTLPSVSQLKPKDTIRVEKILDETDYDRRAFDKSLFEKVSRKSRRSK